jgi:hypothetical protein
MYVGKEEGVKFHFLNYTIDLPYPDLWDYPIVEESYGINLDQFEGDDIFF